MKTAQAAPKASALEKVVVNLFTPLDLLDDMSAAIQIATFGRVYYLPRTEKVIANLNLFDGTGGVFTYKAHAYEKLLKLLQDDAYRNDRKNTDRIVRPYMKTPCGRIDVLLAVRRGLLSREQYNKLSRKYHINWR